MFESKSMDPDGGSTAVQSITESDVEKVPHEDGSSSSRVQQEVTDHHVDTEKAEPGAAEQGIAELARRLTLTSMHSGVTRQDNPFLSQSPTLDPWSPQFNVKEWGKSLLRAMDEDPDKYPRHPFGVSWRDLSVHGYGYDTDYQKTVINVLWRGPLIVKEWFSHRKQEVQILQDFDGLVRPGEMLLVLGRPGSGVTTLLKTIAGQVHGLFLDAKSHFDYQGVPWDVMHSRFRGEIIYQAENDTHFPMLTVGQTLLFAASARTPKNRFPGVSREMYAQHLRDVVMAVFGISHTIDTKIGSDFVRGVSGGERKRVSIAEVTLSRSGIQCWDNSTRGLDSATALEFVKTLRLSTELAGTAAIVALYQASQPAYDTFDKVVVLYEGRQIYFGPKDSAKQYFIDLGYYCPERQTTADFLTSITNPSERLVRDGFEHKAPRTPEDFAEAWKHSSTRAQLLRDIAAFEGDSTSANSNLEELKAARKLEQASLIRNRSPYTIGMPMQVRLCVKRGLQRLTGDKTYEFVRILATTVVSLVLGSIYYNLEPAASSMNDRCILLYFAVLFNALITCLEALSLYAQRPIVEKQSRYAWYHPFSEAIASMICDLPGKLLATITLNVPLYFMADLRRDAGNFFIYLLFSFAAMLVMSGIIRTIAQLSKTIQQALTPTAFLLEALVIYTGFVLPTKNMQGWLRWINYLDPLAYAYEAIVINEFSHRRFDCTEFVPAGAPYVNATIAQRACSTAGALPGQDFVDGDYYINNNFEYYHAHLWRNFGILLGFIVFFWATYFLTAEYISFDKSRGEVLLFRRSHFKGKHAVPQDEESGKGRQPDGRVTETTELDDQSTVHNQKQDNIFHWSNVCYDITIKGKPRRILDHVDGWVKPGTLTALMGATGAGKTTLLDVLADRVRVGVVTGGMLVNGQPRSNAFQRQTGYVQQQDLHLETSTVREALRFSAELRQPSTVSRKDKHEYVEEVIQLLGMQTYADSVVGVPGVGLNVEQRKRLTIGVELAAKPDLLLFLDEPTSGLDSQTAWSVATLIRKLSNNGQAILCTIHQPSAMLFQQFDRLLLLTFGGKTVYYGDIGENSKLMTSYFERYGATQCGVDENPAEWMLRAIGAAPGAHTDRDWFETWRNSPEYAAVRQELNTLEQRRPSSSSGAQVDKELKKYYAAPFFKQLGIVIKRNFQQYNRTPSYIYAKLILCGLTSLFIGASFWHADLTESGLQHQMFAIFMLIITFAFLVCQTMPHFIIERDQYEGRERASRVYSWKTFIMSSIVVELPWATIASLLLFVPFYYLVGMNRNAMPTHTVAERGGLFFLLTWSLLIYESTFADMVVAGVNTEEDGAIIALLLFILCLIFCGVMVPLNALPGFWHFMYRVSPFTYLISSFMSAGFANHAVTCSPLELLRFNPPTGMTCGQYLEPYMSVAGGSIYNPGATSACEYCTLADTNAYLASVNMHYHDRWRNVGLVWCYIVFNVAAAFGMYWLARVPKKGLWKNVAKLRAKLRR